MGRALARGRPAVELVDAAADQAVDAAPAGEGQKGSRLLENSAIRQLGGDRRESFAVADANGLRSFESRAAVFEGVSDDEKGARQS